MFTDEAETSSSKGRVITPPRRLKTSMRSFSSTSDKRMRNGAGDGCAAAGQAVEAAVRFLGELQEGRLDRHRALMNDDVLAGGDEAGLVEDLELGIDSRLWPRGRAREAHRE